MHDEDTTPVVAVATPEVSSTATTPIPAKPAIQIIPHREVCDGDTRCDRCRRLGCSGCVHSDGEQIGLCAVCCGMFTEEQLDLHPIPSTEELKTLPTLVMPPALFKKGQKVMIVNTGKIFREWEIMAKALEADNWVMGNNLNKNTICEVVNLGLHLDIPRKGYVYLLKSLSYPERQVLCLENGLDGSEEAVNWKKFFIGQKVLVKNILRNPKFYDPGNSAACSRLKGNILTVSQCQMDRRCYKLAEDNDELLFSHEWLEPIKPFLRKDKAIKGEQFFIKSPIKRLYYIPWVRLQWRGNGRGSGRAKKSPIIPKVYNQGTANCKEVKIEESLFNELRGVHQEFASHWGWQDEGGSGQSYPLAFMLGERNGVLVTALPIFHNFECPGGCGQMVTIQQKDFTDLSSEIIKMKCNPAGIARLGGFSVWDDSARGSSLEILSRYKDFYILSIGRNGMAIQTQDRGGRNNIHNYQVVKYKDIKKGGITDDALIQTETPAQKAEEVKNV